MGSLGSISHSPVQLKKHQHIAKLKSSKILYLNYTVHSHCTSTLHQCSLEYACNLLYIVGIDTISEAQKRHSHSLFPIAQNLPSRVYSVDAILTERDSESLLTMSCVQQFTPMFTRWNVMRCHTSQNQYAGLIRIQCYEYVTST